MRRTRGTWRGELERRAGVGGCLDVLSARGAGRVCGVVGGSSAGRWRPHGGSRGRDRPEGGRGGWSEAAGQYRRLSVGRVGRGRQVCIRQRLYGGGVGSGRDGRSTAYNWALCKGWWRSGRGGPAGWGGSAGWAGVAAGGVVPWCVGSGGGREGRCGGTARQYRAVQGVGSAGDPKRGEGAECGWSAAAGHAGGGGDGGGEGPAAERKRHGATDHDLGAGRSQESRGAVRSPRGGVERGEEATWRPGAETWGDRRAG
jgi:hypothetical protein